MKLAASVNLVLRETRVSELQPVLRLVHGTSTQSRVAVIVIGIHSQQDG
jgi:hypothetical protein